MLATPSHSAPISATAANNLYNGVSYERMRNSTELACPRGARELENASDFVVKGHTPKVSRGDRRGSDQMIVS